MVTAIVVHGGVGAPQSWAGGCRRAARVGLRVLEAGGTALDGAEAAAKVLEDDGRFNAGSGATSRMDGVTVELDAALMTSEGAIGAVGAARWPKNPIAVARAVMATPHILLVGEGADRFAKKLGFERHEGVHPKARRQFERRMQQLATGKGLPLRWQGQDLAAIWNFATPLKRVLPGGWQGCDTIGVCTMDRAGRFAVANSTGGASPMLLGRVGDSPLPGAGFWAGPMGAVAATGVGEEIARRLLCRWVYGWLEDGVEPGEACRRGVGLFPDEVAAGLIALTATGWGAADNRTMATAYFGGGGAA